MKQIYLIFCLVLAAFCYFQFQQIDIEKNKVWRFKAENDALRRELDARSQFAINSTTNSEVATSNFKPKRIKEIRPEDERARATQISKETKKFAALGQLSTIEGLVVLTPEERKQLLSEFENNAGVEKTQEVLEKVLGPEKAAQIKKAQDDLMDQMESEQMDNQALVLTKKLNLDSAQEAKLRSVFQDAREKFDYKQIEQGSQDSPKESVIAYLKLAKAKREYLARTFQQFMSEEQYNNYLALEASSPESQMHDSFIQSLERE